MAPAAAGRVEKRRGKRAADEELDGERRLRKKFDRLRLEKLSDQAQSGDTLPTTTTTAPITAPARTDNRESTSLPSSSSKFTPSRAENGDGMQVDDTKTRVYITDLEEEIAEIEEEERKQTFKFMPEMEKKLMSIPKSVLTHKPKPEEEQDEQNNELVLYRVPAALGIPAEKDSVRAAMTDARERARERMITAGSYDGQEKREGTPSSMSLDDGERSPAYDSDPMELDDS
ncbi:uncharacterized protein GIQ15_04810 [Arthroderma uncinatum]|uniref:uncharacterized protein n=1 Tax=Arthroderma uncinatum TaxID=74035 RepID=UPI00144A5C6F|nr:uncharacterized protein GIQ15_04810 [Arthroderma uncinatum]KAF3482051.1 hypothetical protein GIQ15_04810 [Arthroderma uncinatum]